jgi:hypothetical protein
MIEAAALETNRSRFTITTQYHQPVMALRSGADFGRMQFIAAQRFCCFPRDIGPRCAGVLHFTVPTR